ncbi:hypothetical protein Cgig2_018349 [Carnegiea gigantea]|uniref:Uncharacterized protein n=1 Tax=Carnegiea gigantea TaxID=171969 RepID=A0A9Q1KXI5_9CARY|nr:hypothetical protein Cgig2_018349 [Carnegiea gigantea]
MTGDNDSFENTWADQWGSNYDDPYSGNNSKIAKSKSAKSLSKKYSMKFSQSMTKTKEAASTRMDKTMQAASKGMKKVKSSASNGFSWVKQKLGKSSSGKWDVSHREKMLELLTGEITDSNTLSQAKLETLFHGCPNTLKIHWKKIILLDWKIILIWRATQRPVNQIQIYPIHLQIPTDPAQILNQFTHYPSSSHLLQQFHRQIHIN